MRINRSGYSLVELLFVFLVIGVIAAIGVPKFDYLRTSSRVRSARDQVSISLATARAAAIQRGRPARLTVLQSKLVLEAQDSSGNWVKLRQPVDLKENLGVLVTATLPDVTYNSRGFARVPGGQKYVLMAGDQTDSVCVSGLGIVMRRGCM